jgi:hypothetical protein
VPLEASFAPTTLIRPVFRETGLSSNHDLDVLVEHRQQIHQAFDGETREPVLPKGGYLRLRHAEHPGGMGLREVARFKHLVQG